MNSIGKYIFRQLALATLFVTVVLTVLVSLFGSLRLIDFIVNRGLPVSVLFEMSALNLPKFVAILLPVAVFSAVLVVYNKLRNDSELVVMRAAGVSPFALARPGLLLGLTCVLFGYALHLYLVPATTHLFKLKQFNYRNSYASVLLQEQRFNTPIDGLTIYVRERAGEGELLGIFAHDSRDPDRPVTYTAERGTAVQGPSGTRVVLFNGSQQDVDRTTGRLTLFNFDQYSLDMGELNETVPQRWRGPEERYLDSLLNPGDSSHDTFYATQLIAEGHRRLTTPLYILAFAAIAVAAMLSGGFDRRGNTGRLVTAIVIVFLVQIASLGLVNMSRRSLAVLPLVYALPIGVIMASLLAIARARLRRPASQAPLAEPV